MRASARRSGAPCALALVPLLPFLLGGPLLPGSWVSGRVLREDGSPACGVEVVSLAPTPGGDGAWERTRTGGDGRFALAVGHPGTYRLLALARDRAPALGSVETPRHGVATAPSLRLERGIDLSGRVVDSAGRPLRGATVDLVAMEQLPHDAPVELFNHPLGDGRPYRHAITGDDGRFLLPGIRPHGEILMRASAPGFVPLTRAVAASSPQLDDLPLQRAGSLRILVADDTGAPVAGATVDLERPPATTAGGGIAPREESDVHGRVDRADLEPGEWRVTAFAAGFRPGAAAWADVEPGAQADVQLELERPATSWLESLVLAADGVPIAGAQLRLESAQAEAPFRQQLSTADDGRVRFDKVPLGLYYLSARHPLYRPTLLRDQRVTVAGATPTITLARGDWDLADVSGRVVAGDGTPVAGVHVALERQGAPWAWQDATTAADGSFRLESLPTGIYSLSWSAHGYAAPTPRRLLLAAGGSDDLVLPLDRGVTVRGTLRGLVDDRQGEVALDVHDANGEHSSSVGPDGTFAVPGLAGGPALLAARQGTRGASVAVELPAAGEVTGVEVDLPPPLQLTGRVTWRRSPVAGGRVVLHSRSSPGAEAWTLTDTTGAYVLDDLGPGEYLVDAALPRTAPVYEGTLSLDRDRQLDLELRAAAIGGALVGSDGSHPEVVDFRLGYLDRSLPTDTYPELVRPDASGHFLTGPLLPGRWRLTVNASGYEPAASVVDLSAGEDVTDVRIELRPAGATTPP